MDELIQQITSRLGTDGATARAAAGSVLGALKDAGDPDDVKSLLDGVPGASDLLAAAPSGGGGGGGLGGLLGKAASSLGGGAGDLVSRLGASGLDPSKTGSLVTMVIGFLKEKVGGDLIGRLLAKAPGLGKLLG
jgi:hypothetical protein